MWIYRKLTKNLSISLAIVAVIALFASPSYAHCDGMDGPVVTAARSALELGDVNRVLIWVRKNDETEIRRVFTHTLNVRKLSPQAKELADTYFFETLVRIHRAGEGAPFVGLQPAGRDIGPAIPAADQALKSADIAPLVNLLVDQMRDSLLKYYEQAKVARDFEAQNVDAGREYVERYIKFIHYVEGIYEAATRPVEGHYPINVEDVHEEK